MQVKIIAAAALALVAAGLAGCATDGARTYASTAPNVVTTTSNPADQDNPGTGTSFRVYPGDDDIQPDSN